MNKIFVSGIELTYENAGEILRMSGPWVGDVFTGEELISKDCIVDNFILKENTNLLFFVKYHTISEYSWYFTINFYDIKSKNIYEFNKEFEMLYLKEFVNENQIHVFISFNDKAGNNYYFNLDEGDFHLVS